MITDLYQLPALKQMENLARERSDVISLSQGIPFLPSDDSVRLAVIDAILQGKVDKYSEPQGLLTLRKLISQKLLDEKIDYTSDEIIITAGAIEALTATLLFLGKDGGEIIIPTPTYSAYFRSATVAGLTIKTVLLNEKEGWHLDIDKIKNQATPQTKAILLCNPNNPTGNIYDKETLSALSDFAVANNIYLLVDEVYANIHWQKEKLYTPCEDQRYKEHIIRIVSFSKDFSMTGWRVGFLNADVSIVKKLLPYHDTLINCAPVVSQYAAMACLLHEEKIRMYTKQIYTEQRNVMGKALESLSDYITFSYPEGSYFFFPKIKDVTDDSTFCLDLLNNIKVAVVPGSDFGPGGKGHIRLCFGRDPEDIREGMLRLQNYFKNKL